MAGEMQSSVAGVMSPGMALAVARKAQGLTVEQVAGRLRLAPFQIKAIEAGDFAMLPGAVFARGFVRNYARLLNLDAEPLLSAMAHPSENPSPDERLLREVKGVVMNNPLRFRGLPVAAVVTVCVVSALAFYEFVLNDTQTTTPADQVSATPARAVAPEKITQPALASAVLPETPDAAPKSASDVAAGSRGLHFLFSRESWVEVRDGLGNILFSKINLPGTEYYLQGEPPFNIIVGSAHGVQLAYNGNPVDLAAHATEDVARLRLQ